MMSLLCLGFFSCMRRLTWIRPPRSYSSIVAWTWSMVVLRVFVSYGSIMPRGLAVSG